MNFAVLLLPDFALQALRRAEPRLRGKAVAWVRGEGRKACVAEVSPEARGIETGIAVTLALARCPGLLLVPRNPGAENEAARILVAAALTVAPRVEMTAAGYCTVDLQGADPTRTEKQLHACVGDLATAGLIGRAGAGATPLLAYYAAERAQPVMVVCETTEFLAPLPVAVAAPSPNHVDVLRGWGIATLGQLTALPKAEMGRRLGTEGVQLWERAAGETTRVLSLVEPPRSFAAEWIYEPPVESMEPLLFRLRRFAECVALELRAAGMVADRLSLVLLLEDESDHRREFRLPEPTAQVDSWLRVLQSHLDTVRTEARVTGVRLLANPARPPEKQDGLFDTGLRDPATFWENLARLGAVVGDNCVGTPVVLDTWKPDSVMLEKPVETVPAPEDDPIHPPRGLTLRRFRPPWSARVHLVDHRPVAVEAETLRDLVREAYGPFLHSGSWWQRAADWEIEVWQVAMGSGAIYQLVRSPAGWSVEGLFD